MTVPVHTVRADAPLDDAVALLEQRSITTLPVVDEGDVLVGLISEFDVLRQQTAAAGKAGGAAPGGQGSPAPRVGEVMSSRPLVAWPEADVADIAAAMVEQGVHSVPVVVEEHVIGIVSRCDVLRTILPTDESAQREAQRRLDSYAGGRHRWPVAVHDAAATVDGSFDDDTELAVAEVLVRTTVGVNEVRVTERSGPHRTGS
ncbi:CBS domain-containing protein [Dactylosporangium sp. NPDC005555]|uniref:CBS domain-containing protein n=1 Tax=Dactylosporangium sp. NPDC005555 TaxID=3154889 RepID=UPI0033BD2796